MQIRIDHHSDEAREARARVTALASALEETREEYLVRIEDEIRRVLEQNDPKALTQAIADLVDAGAIVAYALGTSLAQEWDVDLGSLFRGVERFLDEKQPEEDQPAPEAESASGPAEAEPPAVNGRAPAEEG